MAAVIIDKSDLAALNITLNTLKQQSPVAIVRATNEAMAGVKTESAKQIGAKVTLKAALIKQAFEINKMKITDLSADITCKGDPVPLIFYSNRQVNKGMSIKVKKSGGRKIVKHAFKIKFKSGHEELVWRDKRVAGKGRWPVGKRMVLPSPKHRHPAVVKQGLEALQLPVNVLYGPRVPDVYDDPDIIDPVLANAKIRFQNRLEHHVQRMIDMAR